MFHVRIPAPLCGGYGRRWERKSSRAGLVIEGAFCMRKALRGAVEFAMVASGLPVLGRRRRRGDTLVLAYHNVVPDGAEAFGDRSLHLPLSRLRQQLAALEATHEVVSLDELETPARTERPRAAITFDDAYAGALHL